MEECEFCKFVAIDYFNIVGYVTVAMCVDCRDKILESSPDPDCVDPDDAGHQYEVFDKDGRCVKTFDRFEELREFIEDHAELGYIFGFAGQDITQTQHNLFEFESLARLEAWRGMEEKNEDNTLWTPKDAKWYREEYCRVTEKYKGVKAERNRLMSNCNNGETFYCVQRMYKDLKDRRFVLRNHAPLKRFD
jgi:hypothetical protein